MRKLDVPILCLQWVVCLLIADETYVSFFSNKWVRFPCLFTSFLYILVPISAVLVVTLGKVWVKDQ